MPSPLPSSCPLHRPRLMPVHAWIQIFALSEREPGPDLGFKSGVRRDATVRRRRRMTKPAPVESGGACFGDISLSSCLIFRVPASCSLRGDPFSHQGQSFPDPLLVRHGPKQIDPDEVRNLAVAKAAAKAKKTGDKKPSPYNAFMKEGGSIPYPTIHGLFEFLNFQLGSAPSLLTSVPCVLQRSPASRRRTPNSTTGRPSRTRPPIGPRTRSRRAHPVHCPIHCSSLLPPDNPSYELRARSVAPAAGRRQLVQYAMFWLR